MKNTTTNHIKELEIKEGGNQQASKGGGHIRRVTDSLSSGAFFNGNPFSFSKKKEQGSFQSQNSLSEYRSSQGFYMSDSLYQHKVSQKPSVELQHNTQSSHSSVQNTNSTSIMPHQPNNNSSAKWTQEQVYASFYKMKENKDVILIPDKFWELDKPFLPFKQVWADHQQKNAEIVNEYTMKKKKQEENEKNLHSDQNSKKQKSEGNPFDSTLNLLYKPLTKNYFHHQHHCSDIEKEKLNKKIILYTYQRNLSPQIDKSPSKDDKASSEIADRNKNISSIQLIDGKKRNMSSHEKAVESPSEQKNQGKPSNSLSVLESHNKSISISEMRKFSHNLGQNHSKRRNNNLSYFQHFGNPNSTTANFYPSCSSLADLTQKEEIYLQLSQNRYSREVYDSTLNSLEQQVYSEAFDQIQNSLGKADKIQRRTKVYNKRQQLDQLDDPFHQPSTNENKKQSILLSNERELPMLNPTIMYCWIENDKDTWKPMPRVGSTLTSVGIAENQRLYLIGGISSDMIKEVLVISPDNYTYDTLSKIEEQNNEEQDHYRETQLKKRNAGARRMSKLYKVQPNTPNINDPKRIPLKQESDYEDIASKYLFQNGNYTQRYNHTTVETTKKSKLLIFGGEILSQDQQQQNMSLAHNVPRQKFKSARRNCMNDLISYDILTREWKVHVGRGDVIEARRNHTSTMVSSKHMVILGGLNSEGHALSDVCVLDITTFRWVIINTFYNLYQNPFPNGIAYHAACFVSEEENSSSFNALGVTVGTKEPKKNIDKNATNSQFIKDEGLYVFGGIDEEGNYLKNKMLVLKQVGNPPTWTELNITGRGPEKRCMHSMNFMFSMSLCVIFGGKYESASSTKYFDDIFVVNLKTLNWIEVSHSAQKKSARAMHSSCVYNKQLIIFGGLNEKGFVRSNIDIIEFDQTLVMKLKRMMNFSLTAHQEIKSKKYNQLESIIIIPPPKQEEQPITIENQEDEANKQPPKTAALPPQNLNKFKSRMDLIDPEREREINSMNSIPNIVTSKIDPEHKWKPPIKPKILQPLTSPHSNFPPRTFLPFPQNCGKRPNT